VSHQYRYRYRLTVSIGSIGIGGIGGIILTLVSSIWMMSQPILNGFACLGKYLCVGKMSTSSLSADQGSASRLGLGIITYHEAFAKSFVTTKAAESVKNMQRRLKGLCSKLSASDDMLVRVCLSSCFSMWLVWSPHPLWLNHYSTDCDQPYCGRFFLLCWTLFLWTFVPIGCFYHVDVFS